MIDPMAIAKALGAPAGAAAVPLVAMYALFTPADEYSRHVAESERGYILDIVEKARGEPNGGFKDSLCRTLDEAIARLCASAPDDALCMDRKALRERAGCPQ
jgi:hypothetical protein